jgi:four helix bundle protein
VRSRESGLNTVGERIAACGGMKEPSDKRKRTLALHARALKFTTAVNDSCPQYFTNKPSAAAWDQLIRAANGTSNNLIEADAASSNADFLSKMSIALREAKESNAELAKIRMGRLDHHKCAEQADLESEAGQLASIYATIILNMRARLEREKNNNQPRRGKRSDRTD